MEEQGEVEEEGEVDDVGAQAAGAPSAGHKRPRGRAPKGKLWNGATGQWDALQTAPAAAPPAEARARPPAEARVRPSVARATDGAARKRRASMLK